MPFYEYECSSCKYYTEVMQKITDSPLRKCPSCGKSTLQKLVSAPVFRLKGGGWYETDFKSDKETKRNLADEAGGKESSEPKADTAGASEPKPAAPKAPRTAKKPAASKPAAKPAASAKAKKPARPAATGVAKKPKAAR